MRHNHIRDTVAEVIKEVCFDVQIEPHLMPVEPGDLTLAHSNKEPNASLDIYMVEESGPHLIIIGPC